MILQEQIIFPKLALAAAAGVGIFLLFKKYRTQIWRQINSIVNYNDPLRNQEIQVVTDEEECETFMHKLKRYTQMNDSNEISVYSFEVWPILQAL